MSRKDYKLIATALSKARPKHWIETLNGYQWNIDCIAIADALALDNPRFDRKCFLTATATNVLDAEEEPNATHRVKGSTL
jgi:hypothetical protein